MTFWLKIYRPAQMACLPANQGCQIFLGTMYQNGKNIPDNPEIYQMATKYTQ
jgi:hypothetical protein